jgi:hypothetical protein
VSSRSQTARCEWLVGLQMQGQWLAHGSQVWVSNVVQMVFPPDSEWTQQAARILSASFPELGSANLVHMMAMLMKETSKIRRTLESSQLLHMVEFFCGTAAISRAGFQIVFHWGSALISQLVEAMADSHRRFLLAIATISTAVCVCMDPIFQHTDGMNIELVWSVLDEGSRRGLTFGASILSIPGFRVLAIA